MLAICLSLLHFRVLLPIDIQIEIAIAGPWIGQADPFPLPQCHQFVLVAQQFPLPKEAAKALNKPR